jgi:hypothetical protein
MPPKKEATCCIAECQFASRGIISFKENFVEDHEMLPSSAHLLVEGNQEPEPVTSSSIPETPHGHDEHMDATDHSS